MPGRCKDLRVGADIPEGDPVGRRSAGDERRSMIEFKAECGHAVRARDEDAGGVVRCSYCGRNASVPAGTDHSLDYLFAEVQQAHEEPGRRRRRRKAASRGPGTPEGFNPFPIIVRLCYSAALIILAVLVYAKFIAPMLDPEKRAARLSGVEPPPATVEPAPRLEEPSTAPAPAPRGPGLLREAAVAGLYVASAPVGGHVFCLSETKAPSTGRIASAPGCLALQAPGAFTPIADGNYVVEVAFAWNDGRLAGGDAQQRERYTELRRRIEDASHEERRRLVEEYFLPDEASAVLVDHSEGQIYFVRQYRGVVVRGGRSIGVRAIFLPRLMDADGTRFRLEPLLSGLVPDTTSYAFDEAHVRNELNYYRVEGADQRTVLTLLSRVGAVPYLCDDGRIRVFKVDIHDGTFTAPRLQGEP